MGDLTVEHHHHPCAAPAPSWPVLVGRPPALASAFQPRHALRDRILAARPHDQDVVAAQGATTGRGGAGTGTRVLAGGGGVGKSQLAAWFACHAAESCTDLVVWADAASADEVITTYARAAARVEAPGAGGGDPAGDAAALLEWLHTTDRSWLVVLDDVTDPAALAGWWPPHRPDGWTLATTRLRDDPTLVSAGRHQVDIDVYRPAESAAYLAGRLGDAGKGELFDGAAADLAVAVGHLPLALSHAAAYMIGQEEGCTAYLARYAAADGRLAELMPPDIDPDGYGRPVAVTLLLALDAADTAAPAGLARLALALAALLDPAGHPDALWAAPAVTRYLTAHRAGTGGPPVTADQARKTLRLLHRYGLLTHTPADSARAVRIHALTARAARETLADPAAVAHTAADALLTLWPADDYATTELVAALRANTTTLAAHAGDQLWHPDGHPLLYRAGLSLLRAGLHTATVVYWHHLTGKATRLLGAEHPDTQLARGNLAFAYGQAGRIDEAISLLEQVVADTARQLGDEHPSTLIARGHLACPFEEAGRTDEAISLLERVVADTARLLGDEHPSTLIARVNLATSYGRAGRTGEAIVLEERVVADAGRLLGDEDPDTLIARANLAASYREAGRTGEAILIEEKVIADTVRLLGDEHPDTLIARGNLAASYGRAGRTAEAIGLEERVVADRARLLGDEHPSTLIARANLAASYGRAGRTGEAIALEERVVADAGRLLGDQHPDTLRARGNLAASYRQAGRTAEAIAIEERIVADTARLPEAEHPNTAAATGALPASAHRTTSRPPSYLSTARSAAARSSEV
ncbi:tetratricopeptide repeat protein [Pseudofrankia saprophytica]|uniref:tetratricopeptide repeat protein n=1 Tax=Pseudofrankia saprophytica TaxID=298655 RepID=UPI000D086AFE|nr:tetratricopeptide repeat protein [Pseudofrankia saprophytica]